MSFAVVASISGKRPSPCAAPRPVFPWRSWFLGLALIALCGCAGTKARQASFPKPFTFGEDTFCYRNDLKWVYYRDPDSGKFTHRPRIPEPDYTHHCFVVARAARQFFQHARFEPSLPKADEATYRKCIKKVVGTSARAYLEPEERVVIPGYTNLFGFSRAWEGLLKAECGGAWQSYFQRGHWRMIMPFSRSNQRDTAAALLESVRRHRPAVVHVAKFPQLSINHAVVVFGAEETEKEILFAVYDPYDPDKPARFTFDRESGRFQYPANDYFVGGPLNVYEIYCSRCF